VRARDSAIRNGSASLREKFQHQKKQRKSNLIAPNQTNTKTIAEVTLEIQQCELEPQNLSNAECITEKETIAAPIAPNPEPVKPKKPVPFVRVYEDYEQLSLHYSRREAKEDK
jgi:putative transposase